MFDPIINGKLNRLLEGGGYSETEKKVLLPETAVDFVDDIYLLDFVPVADTMYTVALNGEQYKVKSVGVDVGGGVLLVFVGNLNMMLPDFPATSEPFVIVYAPDSAETVLTHKDGDIGTITISISEETETIHPIDPKYLPGVCLPVVELSTTFVPGVSFTDAENQLLTAAYEKNTPVVIKCNVALNESYTFENTAVVWSPMKKNVMKFYIASFCGVMLQIVDAFNAGNWVCGAE